jgi:MFS family permease
MLRQVQDSATRVVYAAALVVGIGYGVSIALTALRLNALGFGKPAIGSLAAVFASGIVIASLPMAAILKRFSAKNVLVVSLVGYAVCVAAFPFLESAGAISTARFFDGACSVATWICFETILLRRAEAHHKAYVMSLYAIAVALGYMLGPLLAKLIVAFAPMRLAFLASSALATAACVLVALRLDRADAERVLTSAASASSAAHATHDTSTPAVSAVSMLEVVRRIRTSLFAVFAYGYFQASVVLFLPLFLIERKGIAENRTILIPAFFAAGMLLFSNAAGRLGDRLGHLLVMRTLGAIGSVMVAGFVWLESWPLMCGAIFVAGATLASISPVSLALQGVVVDSGSYGRANSIYNGVYALGMLVGPPVSSLFFQRLGGGAMLWHLAALWGAFVVFTVVFAKDDPAAGDATVRARRASDAAAPAAYPAYAASLSRSLAPVAPSATSMTASAVPTGASARAVRPIDATSPSSRIRSASVPTSRGLATTPAPVVARRCALIPSLPGTSPATIMGRPAVRVSLTVRPPALPTTR